MCEHHWQTRLGICSEVQKPKVRALQCAFLAVGVLVQAAWCIWHHTKRSWHPSWGAHQVHTCEGYVASCYDLWPPAWAKNKTKCQG